MVKQFQKPKGNGGRQRKFVFCGKNYCFVSWFRENKPFRARIHFGSTYSIGTYSDLEKCLRAIAEFTRDKVMETTGLEQRGWRQRDEKALAQLQGYLKDKEMEEAAIRKHFDEKKGRKKTTKKSLSVPRRKKLMEKTSPSIPPATLKLEPEVPPIILEEEREDDLAFLFAPQTMSLSKQDQYYNPHLSDIVLSPVISPTLSMDILEPPSVLSPIVNDPFTFVAPNLVGKKYHGKQRKRFPFKLKIRGQSLQSEPAWWEI